MFDFDTNLLKKYFDFLKVKKSNLMFLSEEIAKDLELDLIFFKLNSCFSNIGKQYFYAKLRANDEAEFIKMKSLLSSFKNNEIEKEKVSIELKKLNHRRDYDIIDLVKDDITTNNKYYQYAKFSLFSVILIIVCSFFIPKISLFLVPFFIVNLIVHYLNKNFVDYYNSIIFRLKNTISVADKLAGIDFLRDEYQEINLKKFKKNMTLVEFETTMASNEYFSVLWIFSEIIKVMFSIEIFTFRNRAKTLNSSKEELLKLFECLGKTDMALTLLQIQENYQTCEPVFVKNKEMKIENVYHPFIENCVKNTFQLDGNSMVITGSNMSGKTSFMRNIAINVIFAQNFGFCFADYFLAPKMKIMSSISIHDNMNENKSYYLEEVLRIKEFLVERDEYALILIDEIFKGTNTKERIAISKAVLQSLNHEKNIVFVTSHDLEIAQFLQNHHYDLYYFDEEVKNNELFFPYLLKRGINHKTNAIRILEMYNYPAKIINKAHELANHAK